MLVTLERSTILRLRVKGSDLDPLALRGRLENVLNDVSLQPRLPPTATLFIRKLDDPLPGSIQLDSPHARAPHAWRHAFQTRFDQLVSSAARPAHGFVADSAESVVFYDYAELLACLTADWCSGSAMTRWWWQALLRRGDIAQMIRRFWREKIEYVPAGLEFLVRKGVVVEFVSQLSDVEVLEIFERVVRVFSLTRITRIKATDLVRVAVAREVTRATHVPEMSHVSRVRSVMPWRHIVPETDTPRLRPVQQLFVGVALMTHRAPSRVRTVSFAREVEQWIEAVISAAPEKQTIVENNLEFFHAPESGAPIRENPIEAPPAILRSAPPPQESVKSAVQFANATFTYEEVIDVIQRPSPPSITEPELVIEPKEIPELFVPTTLDDVTLETELGGLFYLINLALFMEIYSDFTSPVESLHDDLSIWDFVAIVGKEIDQETNDPIWELLRDFAGRDNEDELITPAWLTDLLPHILARLHLALGVDDDLAQILLHHHARVSITPTHLDIFFSLADHPIELRLSGLDRNPGWVPAAGRFIAFHYD
jgi:hypothetical protein